MDWETGTMQPQNFSVEEIPDNVVPLAKGQQIAASSILLALKALSQGAAIALGHVANQVFALVTVSMVFWVWTAVPDPNPYQVAAMSLFALFILAANVIVRRK
jgi:hypothetical protein